jgi:hypothetical protein
MAETERNCNGCSACCDGWVQMTIGGVPIYPGRPCPHSTGKGCDDYANRPVDPCVKFVCGWRVDGSPLPDTFRPDRSGVLVMFAKRQWQGRPVDLAVPVGPSIPPPALAWLKRFAEQHGRPLIYTEQIVAEGGYQRDQALYGHGPPAFQAFLEEALRTGRRLW